MLIWGRRMLAIYAVIVAAAMGYAILSPTRDKSDDRQAIETCAQGKEAATDPVTGNISRRGATTLETSPPCQPAHRASSSSAFTGQPQQH
jgi:hypothetical protein